jgi:hypothetical protein
MKVSQLQMKITLHIFVLTLIAIIIPVQTEAASRSEERVGKVEHIDPFQAYQALAARFSIDDNGVVFDTKTGLEWFVGPDKDTRWEEARSWVEHLSIDGGGWRMPTRDELESLYTEGVGTCNISPAFKARAWFVWTGETVGSSYAWGFCFDIGEMFWPRCTFSQGARAFAVRSRR